MPTHFTEVIFSSIGNWSRSQQKCCMISVAHIMEGLEDQSIMGDNFEVMLFAMVHFIK